MCFVEKKLNLFYNIFMKSLIVDEKYNNKKLNTFILDNFKNLNINILYKALRKKDIKINDKRVSDNVILHSGDEVKIFISDEFLCSKPCSFNLDIIYEDDNIILINKPNNIEVISDNSNEVSLTNLLREHYNLGNLFPAPCHRLDRNTTGIVIFAKNKSSLDILLNKFKNHEIEKHYICLVYGIPKIKEKTIEGYLFKDTKKSLVYISDNFKNGYQKIITSYTVLKTDDKNNTSILDVNLHTGKTHQIRAHLAHIGLPIIGDRKIWY